MQVTGTFPEGIIAAGACHRDFTLTEHQFRHSLELANDPAIDLKKLDDPTYYQAAIFGRRLDLAGVGPLTPEQVLGLSGADGQELLRANADLELQRKAFRDAAEAAAAGPDRSAETGD